MKHCDAIITFFYNENRSKVLMLERVKNHYGFNWGFVCGKVEGTESPDECAKREITEEIGLRNLPLKKFKKVEYNQDGETFYHHYYYTTIPENTPLNFQKEEIKSIKWFSFNKLPKSRAPDNPKEALKLP